jgi:hypothetical protein
MDVAVATDRAQAKNIKGRRFFSQQIEAKREASFTCCNIAHY